MTMPYLPVVPARGWRELLARVEPGVILVVGGRGAGKSVFARYLVGQLDRSQGRVALLDTDPGQTSIGVPTCLGLALTGPWEAPAANWFVGDLEPLENLLPMTVGAGRLAERARDLGARTTVIDTPGLVATAAGISWMHHLALACQVDQVIAIQSSRELEPLLRLFEGRGVTVLRTSPSPVSKDSCRAQRAEYSAQRMRAHFVGARTRRFAPDRFIGETWTPGLEPAPEAGRIVGLIDHAGFCLGLGYLREVSVDSILVESPAADDDRLAQIFCGRIRRDAATLGLEETP